MPPSYERVQAVLSARREVMLHLLRPILVQVHKELDPYAEFELCYSRQYAFVRTMRGKKYDEEAPVITERGVCTWESEDWKPKPGRYYDQTPGTFTIVDGVNAETAAMFDKVYETLADGDIRKEQAVDIVTKVMEKHGVVGKIVAYFRREYIDPSLEAAKRRSKAQDDAAADLLKMFEGDEAEAAEAAPAPEEIVRKRLHGDEDALAAFEEVARAAKRARSTCE